jgi:hypothetical protein
MQIPPEENLNRLERRQNIKDLLPVGPLAKEALGSVDSSKRHHRPIYQRGAHRRLITAIDGVYAERQTCQAAAVTWIAGLAYVCPRTAPEQCMARFRTDQ